MRIAYMLTSLGIGGAERQVIALAERMAARGHEVAVIVLLAQGSSEWQTSLPVVHLGMTKSPKAIGRGLMRCRRFLRSFQPDILHSHTFPANIAARVLGAMRATPRVVSTIHNVYEGGLHRTIAYRLTDGFCQRCTAVSQAVADRYVAIGAVRRHKCSVITNGIDAQLFSARPHLGGRTRELMKSNGSFVWLAAGRDVPAKDFDNVIRAFQRIRAQNRKTELWIVGEHGSKRRARGDYPTGGVEPRELEGIRRLGHREDMPEVLAASDAFVLGSAWEGLPLVVGEAMAMERPVVATDVGGVRELVGDAGVMVPPKDPQALANGMLDVMKMTQQDRREMGAAARQRISTCFDIDAKVVEWEALYGALTL